MKTCFYQFEECPNPNALLIHLTEIVPDTDESKRDLEELHGVVDVHTCTSYQVTIIKGTLFKWEELKPALVNRIQYLLECMMEEKKVLPPVLPKIKNFGSKPDDDDDDDDGWDHNPPKRHW